jgi:cobalamin biosynthesis protein CobD/CbiB
MALSVASVALMMAIAMDLALRELPNRWHPVAWMGSVISFYCRSVSRLTGKVSLLLAGLLLVAGGVLAVAGG